MLNVKFALFTVLLLMSNACTDDTPSDNTSIDSLTDNDLETLQFLLEEEKMARDVYSLLGDEFGIQIFKNISNSEQKHMDFILETMNAYNIDPIYSIDAGEFINTEIQNLYNTLTNNGMNSPVDALIVGATIEDLDIYDLDQNIASIINETLIQLYAKLKCGSENHMRAFAENLQNHQSNYSPQYISQSQYNDILSGGHQHCGSL